LGRFHSEAIPPRKRDAGIVPASYGQKGAWLFDQLARGTGANHLAAAWRLQGHIDVAALSDSVRIVLMRHEALRTTYLADDGRLLQVIQPVADVPITLRSARAGSEVEDICADETARAFDLVAGPVLRVTLIEGAPSEHVLLLVVHQIACDTASLAVIRRELAAAYGALSRNRRAEETKLPLQFADFSEWQRQWLETDQASAQLAYWRRHLAEPASPHLPTDHPWPASPSFRGRMARRPIPGPLAAQLTDLCRETESTPYMLLLAAVSVLLYAHTGQRDILVNTASANRHYRGLHAAVGRFANPVLVRSAVEGADTFLDFLARTRSVINETFANTDVPHLRVLEELPWAGMPGRNVRFHAGFAFHSLRRAHSPFGNVHAPAFEFDPMSAALPVDLMIVENASTMTALCQFRTDLFHERTMHRFLLHFETLIGSVALSPARAIGSLQMLSQEERRSFVALGTSTPVDSAAGTVKESSEHQRASLQSNRPAATSSRPPYVGPRDAIEAALLPIWQEVFEQEVGVTDNFFDMGGHSLLAVRLLTRIEADLNYRFGMAILFEAGSVEELAQRIREGSLQPAR
jgi:hypothetical protein